MACGSSGARALHHSRTVEQQPATISARDSCPGPNLCPIRLSELLNGPCSRHPRGYAARTPNEILMDFTALQSVARSRLPDDVWAYFQGAADGDADGNSRAWAGWDLVPRILTGLTSTDTLVTIGGDSFASPLVLAPSASQGACHPDGELATRRAAAALGVLAIYSFHATVEVERFAAAAESPWWAQLYVMKDRGVSDGYLRRCVAAGATAVVLTADVPGTLADLPFRRALLPDSVALRGNHPRGGDGPIPIQTESNLGPDEIKRTADIASLPVWVKGIMTAEDAVIALEAGAAGVFVSNHARRQLAGVAPTAAVLPEIVDAVAGRVPVMIDGGVRSGTDVVRGLALGASAVAIGRPVPWALAVGGQTVLEEVLATLVDEIRVAMAGLGAARVADIGRRMVRPAFGPPGVVGPCRFGN